MQSALVRAIDREVNPGLAGYPGKRVRQSKGEWTAAIAPRANAQKHTSRNPLQRWLIRRFHARVADLLSRHGEGRALRVLDTGCGEGFGARALIERGAVSAVFGVDADPVAFGPAEMLDLLRPVCADAGSLPYGAGMVDAVVCLEVLEHLEHPATALQELCRIATGSAGAGGLVVLSVPHQPWFSVANFLRGKNWPTLGDDPDHRHAWRPRAFVELVERHAHILAVELSFPWLIVVARPRRS